MLVLVLVLELVLVVLVDVLVVDVLVLVVVVTLAKYHWFVSYTAQRLFALSKKKSPVTGSIGKASVSV